MLKFPFFLCVALQHFLAMGQECPICPEGFMNLSDLRCYKVITTPKTWDEAYQTCRELNSHLVIIRNKVTNDYIKEALQRFNGICSNNVTSEPTYWVAGKRYCSNKYFVWVPQHGSKFQMSYTFWYPGEPNNANGEEHCIHIKRTGRGGFPWNDAPCHLKYCSICEIDL